MHYDDMRFMTSVHINTIVMITLQHRRQPPTKSHLYEP